jgi:MurNAc alpha-1-phosphate uridylyltransferase
MRPDTDSLPKCLLSVAGRPFIDWQLAWLATESVDRVVYSIGYRGERIRDHAGDGRRFGLEVGYVDEGSHLLGTGGALRLAVDQAQLGHSFLVLYGDSYLPIELKAVELDFTTRQVPALMTVYRDVDHLDHPNAVFADGMVIRYEKGLADPPPEMSYVDYGLSVWQSQTVEELVPLGDVADMATLFNTLSRTGRLAGFEATERFYEIGSREGLADLEARLRSGGALGTPLNSRLVVFR